MRVITGRFKGRRLTGPREPGVRPTSDRLKESLFDILATRVQGSIFVDFFAGTGSIGIEAISRGAETVIFVESNRDCCGLIRRNLAHCGIESGFRLVAGETFSVIRSLARSALDPDILFFDPPYDFIPYDDLLKLVFRVGLAKPGALVVIEHHARAPVPDGGAGFECYRKVCQGEKRLSFFSEEKPPSTRDIP